MPRAFEENYTRGYRMCLAQLKQFTEGGHLSITEIISILEHVADRLDATMNQEPRSTRNDPPPHDRSPS